MQLVIFTILCVILGVSLRVTHIKAHIFWHDEVHTMLRAFGSTTQELVVAIFDGKVHDIGEIQAFQRVNPEKSLWDSVESIASHPEHGPLYYFLVRLTTPYFNPPIAGARFLAVFFSLFLFPAMYLLAKELFPAQAKAPLVAVCLSALSPIHILYAREARQYSLYEVLVIISTFQFLKACRKGRGWVLYGILLSIGLYTHLMIGVLILSHGCFLIIDRESRIHLKKFLTSVLVAVLSFIPWIWVITHGLTDMEKYTSWMKLPLPLDLLVLAWAEHAHHILFDLPGETQLMWISVPLVLFCFLYTLVKSNRRSAVILGMIICFNFFPLVFPDLISGGQRSAGARYVLPAMLCLQLCMVFFISELFDKKTTARWSGQIIMIMLLVGTGFFAYAYFTTDTWWNRYCSINNSISARLINARPNPLVVADTTSTNPGEVISMSYLVKPDTLFLTLKIGETAMPPAGHSVLLLNPSWELQQQLRNKYGLSPVVETHDSLWVQEGSKVSLSSDKSSSE